MGPDDIELSDETLEVERRPRAGMVVSVRLPAAEADRLLVMAEQRRTTVSKIAREAIAQYLAGGTSGVPVGSPWTGTTTGSANLELIYASGGIATVRTSGDSVIQTERPTLARAS